MSIIAGFAGDRNSQTREMLIVLMTSFSAAIRKTVSFQFSNQFSDLWRHKKNSNSTKTILAQTVKILECVTVINQKRIVSATCVAEIVAACNKLARREVVI